MADSLLERLGIGEINSGASVGGAKGALQTRGEESVSFSPIDGRPLASVRRATAEDYEEVMARAGKAMEKWIMTPAPARGQIVREMGDILRRNKDDLGRLVTLEMGKILPEGRGEVQEMVDVADFAVGLSRQLYGLTMPSERPRHRLYEQWHPLGRIGVITAFNFPVAVWSWNALIGAVCGDLTVWKPSSKTPLTALAVMHLLAPVIDKHDLAGVFNLVIGRGAETGERMIGDRRLPLISATGSCDMGRRIGQAVAARLGRTILELGGNNAVIVARDTDLELALRAVLFGAVGTAGQRCTSTRRLIIHESVREPFLDRLKEAYGRVRIGDPLAPGVLMGPLVDGDAADKMARTLEAALAQGAEIVCGGGRLELKGLEGGHYVRPTIVAAPAGLPVMAQETFAPILYVTGFNDLEEALRLHNSVDQGLSSSIFTDSLKYSERFLSHLGSDCGIANVNVGTSGAEIGGAFGGEKDTGGGRESGSDAWKGYMRRQTVTLNWGDEMPLSQGIEFDPE